MTTSSFHGNKRILPGKICAACNREFTWRRKWREVWSEVRYCSTRCRRNASNARAAARHSIKDQN
ncbi:MAG: DUF2256 domain-containing protein [Gammaproteobacteria bacterium]|nr:DUF2256 domain-containing protein [Pseudomonadales bacterium]